tara:strand:+ start:724 stop:1080 length:357 start_codon:yes stop_codon:yes gene_type:complete
MPSKTEINITFEPILDDDIFYRESYEMDVSRPNWLDDLLDGLDDIITNKCPDYDCLSICFPEYDEEQDIVHIQITSPKFDYLSVEEKIIDYLKNEFPFCHMSISGNSYDLNHLGLKKI